MAPLGKGVAWRPIFFQKNTILLADENMKLLITYKCKNVYYIKGVRNLIDLVFLPLFNMW